MRYASIRVSGPLAVLTAVAAATMAPSIAEAKRVCDKRADVLTHLAKKYSEKPTSVGVTANGGIVELLSEKSGKTWTLIVSMPNGISCLLAAGQDWDSHPLRQIGERT